MDCKGWRGSVQREGMEVLVAVGFFLVSDDQ